MLYYEKRNIIGDKYSLPLQSILLATTSVDTIITTIIIITNDISIIIITLIVVINNEPTLPLPITNYF